MQKNDKREKLVALLQAYVPAAHEEIEAKRTMLAFIEAHENCFERSLEVGHITASSWLVSKDGAKALLMHHAKLHAWLQLGGHCDGDSDVLAVAIKEAQEESGINTIVALMPEIFDIDVHLIPQTSKHVAHYHYDVRFLLRVASDEVIIPNSESNELRWISKNSVELPTSEKSIVRMFNKWLAL